jgi:RNA polymerase sigma factor (sigma-70 family)
MTTEQTAGDIFRKHYAELCRYVRQKFSRAGEADDIVQDAFQNILNIDCIDSLENPRAYLYRTAKNIALNRMRREECQSGIFVELEAHEPLSIPMDRQIIAERDMQRVIHALAGLPDKDRTTFLLNRMEGKTYTEISQQLGISVSSVEKRIMKVLSAVRQTLDEG